MANLSKTNTSITLHFVDYSPPTMDPREYTALMLAAQISNTSSFLDFPCLNFLIEHGSITKLETWVDQRAFLLNIQATWEVSSTRGAFFLLKHGDSYSQLKHMKLII
jgi:hypothetical protein